MLRALFKDPMYAHKLFQLFPIERIHSMGAVRKPLKFGTFWFLSYEIWSPGSNVMTKRVEQVVVVIEIAVNEISN